MSKLFSILTSGILVIFLFSGCAALTASTVTVTVTVPANSSIPQTTGVINVNYDDLCQLASANEIAYDANYKSRVLQLSNLRVVSVQSTANPRVNLISVGENSFTLYFNSTAELAQLTPGMLLTVQATSIGVYFSKPAFDTNCVLISWSSGS